MGPIAQLPYSASSAPGHQGGIAAIVEDISGKKTVGKTSAATIAVPTKLANEMRLIDLGAVSAASASVSRSLVILIIVPAS